MSLDILDSLDPLDAVRVGIIGPSWWVDYWHLAALQSHPDVLVTAVCGEKERDPAEVKVKYGSKARYFTDLDAMLDTSLLDGVIVCTPNHLHHPATMAALHAGLHVTCEKPMAMDVEQAQEMLAVAESRRLIHMINFPYRDNPAVKEFAAKIEQGYVGTPLHISGAYHGGYALGGKRGWRGFHKTSGAGILGDLGSHLIDLARYVMGQDFRSVCAHSLTVLKPTEDDAPLELRRTEDPKTGDMNDDSCTFLAEFTSGAQGIFHTSWIAHQGAYRQHQELEVYGSEGRLHFAANFAGTFLRGMRRGDQKWEWFPIAGTVTPEDAREENEDYFRPGRHTPTNTTYRWLTAIQKNDHSLAPSFYDGLKTQEVIDAVVRSSAARQWIDLKHEGDDDEEEPEAETEYVVFD
jgi:predicted dehydrogenase